MNMQKLTMLECFTLLVCHIIIKVLHSGMPFSLTTNILSPPFRSACQQSCKLDLLLCSSLWAPKWCWTMCSLFKLCTCFHSSSIWQCRETYHLCTLV